MECTPKKNPDRWKAEAVVFCTASFEKQPRLRLVLRLLNPLVFFCGAMYVFLSFPPRGADPSRREIELVTDQSDRGDLSLSPVAPLPQPNCEHDDGVEGDVEVAKRPGDEPGALVCDTCDK